MTNELLFQYCRANAFICTFTVIKMGMVNLSENEISATLPGEEH